MSPPAAVVNRPLSRHPSAAPHARRALTPVTPSLPGNFCGVPCKRDAEAGPQAELIAAGGAGEGL